MHSPACRVFVCAQKMSDHKPVYALFSMVAKTVVESKKAAVYRDVMRRLDDIENRSLPKLTLSDPILYFGDVAYRTPVTRTLRLNNVGTVCPAGFVALQPADW